MKLKKRRILSIALILLGWLLLKPSISPTGFVIGTTIISYSFIGTILFLIGIILLLTEKEDPKEQIEEIIRKYGQGKIDAIHAAAELDEVVEIQNVKYRTGKQHAIVGERNIYALPESMRHGRKAEELAIVEYLIAIRNNPQGSKQNNLEFKKGLSTKHYMKELIKIIKEFRYMHDSELEEILGIT